LIIGSRTKQLQNFVPQRNTSRIPKITPPYTKHGHPQATAIHVHGFNRYILL